VPSLRRRRAIAIRSFVIKDGHLFLALMADGGLYEFEAVPPKKASPALSAWPHVL
jgi:hypothetical protein